MNRIKKWLSINAYKHIRIFILIMIACLNVALVIVGGILLHFASPEAYSTVWKGMWQIFVDILDPGFLNTVSETIDAGLNVTTVVEVIVMLICMVTFTGAIIGYISSGITTIISNYKSGSKNLYVKDHILILNWNNQAAGIITEYLYTEICEDVIVLSTFDREIVEKEVTESIIACGFGKKQKHVNVIVKQGEPFSYTELNGVCAQEARTIIVLSDKDPQYGAMRTMKTTMMVSQINSANRNCNIVVETDNENIFELVNRLKDTNQDLNIMPIYINKMLGKLLAQVALQPKLNIIFAELFSHEGNEFYSIPFADISGINKDSDEKKILFEYMKKHNRAIPVTSTRSFQNDKSERLFVMSGAMSHTRSLRTSRQSVKNVKVDLCKKYPIKKKKILIFGSNTKIIYIINSFLAYVDAYGASNLCVDFIDTADRLEKIPRCDSFIKVPISNQYDIFEIREVLQNYELRDVDTIVMLSDDTVSASEYDLGVLVSLININKEIQQIEKENRPEVIVEILESQNHEIVQQFNVDNVIISNKYISSLMAQLGDDGIIYELIYDILTFDNEIDGVDKKYTANEDSKELYIKRCGDYFNTLPQFNSKAELIHAVFEASEGMSIPIGLIRCESSGDASILFSDELDKDEKIVLHENDEIVLFASSW